MLKIVKTLNEQGNEYEAVFAVGRTTKDFELKKIDTRFGEKTKATGVSLAVEQYNFEKKEKETVFFTIEAWSNIGCNIAKYVTKGTQIAVFGRLNRNENPKFNDSICVKEFMVTKFVKDSKTNEEDTKEDLENTAEEAVEPVSEEDEDYVDIQDIDDLDAIIAMQENGDIA